jgi:hypothetical protein
MVPSQSGLPTFAVVRCKSAVWRVGDLRPGKPPESKLSGGEGNEDAQGFGKISRSPWARRRLRPNQEKVRSTTQRRGRSTKPFMLSLRLTISVRSGGTFAIATQPARRYSRHRPRSVRAKGSACVFCRGRARCHRGPRSRPSERSARSVDLIHSRSRCSQTARCSSSRGNTYAKSPISRYVKIGRVALGAIARKVPSSRPACVAGRATSRR